VPRIAKIGPYRFFFYSNENDEPPHVHVAQERRLAKFWLDPVELASSSGFPAHTLRDLLAIVIAYRKEFLEHWNEHFSN
jgi:hypothetical protein